MWTGVQSMHVSMHKHMYTLTQVVCIGTPILHKQKPSISLLKTWTPTPKVTRSNTDTRKYRVKDTHNKSWHREPGMCVHTDHTLNTSPTTCSVRFPPPGGPQSCLSVTILTVALPGPCQVVLLYRALEAKTS